MSSPTQSDISISSTSTPASRLTALLQNTGLSPLHNTGWIRVTGEDRVRWLNGMVTNSIQHLTAGEGNYNFFLSVQGRIQGDATIFARPDDLLMETTSPQVAGLIALLDRFIIMDDVELADISSTRSGLLIAGPKAASLLQQIGLTTDNLAALAMRSLTWNDSHVDILHAYSPLIPRYELWADEATTAKLASTLQDLGTTLCEDQSLEWLRVLEGTPQIGTDIRDRELPQETGQTRALHFAKGCYLGQEIVERIRSRGNVHRTFSGFHLAGDLPAAGTSLEADGKQIGGLTSVAAVPLPGEAHAINLGLGYIRREALDRGLPIVYSGGIATPVSLPFSQSAASAPPVASELSERV
ncbi:YgfZ/GcvT domain-containing protein [Tunturiibacter gelidoferens]|uniref:Folate-binding protein YgfZ n=1 Tax=Tunturiibacter lichenicola TaxID=2051959 RepID=A0A7Y9TBK0_9BACT|nr:folate-binding protein YgfZ [Edaphobacter lichenicola]NYF53190.1 folate-binding protein YgfZ [Edaphobacter lichenicola]